MSDRLSNQRENQCETSPNTRPPPRRDSRTGDTEDRDDQQRSRTSSNPKPLQKESPSSSKEKNRSKNNTNEPVDDDKLTVELVSKLKEKMEKKKKPKGTTDEQFIEGMVANIRRKEIVEEPNDDAWEKELRRYAPQCSDDLFDISRAYGDDLKRVAAILQAKIDNPPVVSDTNKDDTPVATSFDDKGIVVLKKLKRLENPKPSTLFRAILEMNDTEIDRADRMFYSQARSLTGDNTYTYENAHDQVQAIRLMSQEIDDEDDLRRFITEHRSFNDAYAYLRKLARDRIRRSEVTTTTPRDMNSRPPNTGKQGNVADHTDNENRTLMNSDSMVNRSSLPRSGEDHPPSNYGGPGRASMHQPNSTTRSGATYNKPYNYNDKFKN